MKYETFSAVSSSNYIEGKLGGEKMAEKIKKLLELTEDDIKYTAHGIAAGCGIGILFGLFFENIVLGFTLGGVIGIVSATIFSTIKKFT
jgi:uncharacterized membrane protein